MNNAMKVGATMLPKMYEISIVGILTLAMTGCGTDSKDQFTSENQPREIHQMMYAHAAAGVRRNATLNQYHFDGASLNSLGRQELDLIATSTKADAALYVYIDLPKSDPMLTVRRQSVSCYLKEAQVDEARIHLESGASPANYAAAAPMIASMNRAEAAQVMASQQQDQTKK
jgi:hypothetical protein